MFKFMLEVVADSSTAALEKAGTDVVSLVVRIMSIAMPIIFGIVTIIGVAYCVVLGVNYAKAEDSDKREEAKKRLTGAVIGFGIAVVASALIWTLSQTIDWADLFKVTEKAESFLGLFRKF